MCLFINIYRQWTLFSSYFLFISWQDNLHLRMKRSELEKYFGVISHEEGRTDGILDLDIIIIIIWISSDFIW